MKISQAKYLCCKENGLRTAWCPTLEFQALWNQVGGIDDANYSLFYVLVCRCGFHNDPDVSPIVAFADHWKCPRNVAQDVWAAYLRQYESDIAPIPPYMQEKFLDALERFE